tara:strand:- start:530 stop:1510 length:981 start_codon:yes stop_codon:yes gene_type:complete
MKKISTIILLLVAITTIIYQQSKNTIKKELRDFAVAEIDKVQKIFFADRFNNVVLLTKQHGKWYVGEHLARENAIELLLNTMQKIEVKNPVAESMHNSVIKSLATNAVKVEVFTHDENTPFKTYYVGRESSDHLGSYMILENSNKAFVMHLPGSNGFLAPKYNIDGEKVHVDLWRERAIFQFKTNTIDTLQITHHQSEERNFSLIKTNESYHYQGEVKDVQTEVINTYMQLFENTYCEGFMNTYEKKDSIFASTPLHSISISANGINTTLHTYNKKPRQLHLDAESNPRKWDIDRMYAKLGDDLLLIQFRTFNPILYGPTHFAVEK